MRNQIYFAFLLLLAGCKGEVQDSWLSPEKAGAFFDTIRAVCNTDNGKLWGKNLYGPLLLIDRTSRKITANFPDNEGLLKEKNGVYTGTFPKELVINYNPVYFGDMLFAMAPLPPQEDGFRVLSRSIRSLFHSFQESEGYSSPGYNTMNMDDRNARLWIKLEWKALRKALTTDGAEQEVALRDALIFRGANRELYQKYAADETAFENYEGLATFTYLLLSTKSQEEYNKRLFELLDRVSGMRSYARSYGSVHGALYATLLYRKGFDFTTIRSVNFDIAGKVKELYGIQLPEVCRDISGSIAMNYEVETIRQEEEKRDAEMRESVHRRISIYTEKPVVYLELESPYFDFEPEDIQPMDTLGIIYSRIRVSDNWGKLTVDGGCLLSNNLKFIRIPAKGFKADRNRYEGDGWHLSLNDGWEMIPVEQYYIIRRLTP